MSDSQKIIIKPIKDSLLQGALPPPGGLKFLTKERLFRVFYALALMKGFRLQMDGAKEAQQTPDGALFKVDPGSPDAEEEEDDYEGIDPDVDCPCLNQAQLRAKLTLTCGRAICCGADYAPDGESVGTAGRLVLTEDCTLWDYTGGSLVTSPCTRTSILEWPDAGPVTTGCEELPGCETPSASVEGCEDAPLCFGAPGPGQMCYSVNDSTSSPSDICLYSDLIGAASAAAEDTVDPDYTASAVDNMTGAVAIAFLDPDRMGQVRRYHWDFKRVRTRIPVHIVIIVRETDLETSLWSEYEDVITIPAGTDAGSYDLSVLGEGKSAEIMSVEVHYGRIPPP